MFGHSSGLGHAITEKLLADDYTVVGISRSTSDLESERLITLQADLSKEAELVSVVDKIKREHATFDVLLFATGTLTAHDINNVNYTDMEYLYRINTFAPMFIESSLLDLVKKNSADIINVTTSALVDYYPKFAEYSSSKAALAKFTKDLQKELQNTECRVLDLCPSGFTSNIYKTMSGDKIDRDESKQMQASDLAKLVVYIIGLPKKMEVTYLYINRK